MIHHLHRKCKSILWKTCKQFVSGSYFLQCTELPPSAVPHISHPLVPKSQWMTASPRGEKPMFNIQHVSFEGTMRKSAPKASPLREKLSENRLFGTDFLTDVGVRRRRRSTNIPYRFGFRRNGLQSEITYLRRQRPGASWFPAYGCRDPAHACGCAGTWGCIPAARRRPGTPGSAPGRRHGG